MVTRDLSPITFSHIPVRRREKCDHGRGKKLPSKLRDTVRWFLDIALNLFLTLLYSLDPVARIGITTWSSTGQTWTRCGQHAKWDQGVSHLLPTVSFLKLGSLLKLDFSREDHFSAKQQIILFLGQSRSYRGRSLTEEFLRPWFFGGAAGCSFAPQPVFV